MNYFNLSLDDQTPYKTAGLNFEAVKWCEKLIAHFPDIKIDLFTSAAYCRLNDREPRFLTQYPDWIKQMNNLSSTNFRVGCHGYYHCRFSAKHQNSNNDEFQFLNESEAKVILEHMIKEFDASGLKYNKIFRPPGWKLSQPTAKVLTQMGFKIAGNKKYYDLLNGKVPGMKYIVSNWEMLDECKLTGNVLACGHTSNWCKNFFNEEVYNKVIKLLNTKQFEFKFLDGV